MIRCATCHLLSYACPGHVGHIELPVPVYHVTFMDQLLRLLRAKCAYCGRLKMPRSEINRFSCKLRLIQYGLLEEAEELETIRLRTGSGATEMNGVTEDSEGGGDSEYSEDDEHGLQQQRNDFVKDAIKQAGGSRRMAKVAAEKVAAVSDERRAVIKEFLAAAPIVKTCGSCRGWRTIPSITQSGLADLPPELRTLIELINIVRYSESLWE